MFDIAAQVAGEKARLHVTDEAERDLALYDGMPDLFLFALLVRDDNLLPGAYCSKTNLRPQNANMPSP